MTTARALRGAALTTGVPLVLGSAVLLAGGLSEWPPWAAVAGVSAASGALALRRAARAAHPPRRAEPAPDEGGTAVYAMQRPVRGVPAEGLAGDAPFALRVVTRTHLALVAAPGSGTGAEAVHIPLTGHNVVLSLTADGSRDVTLVRLDAQVTEHRPLAVDGISMAHRRVPDMVFSPDLLESIQRSVEAYEPLARPDFDVLLDGDPGAVRRLGDTAPALPLTVPAGGAATVVLAPVTGAQHWVHWRLTAEIVCDGRTYTPSWSLTVTAQTGLSAFHPGGARTPASVHEQFPDHWDPAAPDSGPGREEEGERHFEIAAHVSRDGTGLMRGPSRSGPDPEPRESLHHRELGDRHAAAGRLDEAVEAYTAAAEAGSGQAAFMAGKLLHDRGDLAGAERWYRRAVEHRVAVAFNNLGMVALQRGDTEQAERWYRQAMDEGDWAAAVGLGALAAGRGDTGQAETLWKLALDNGQPNAAQNLAILLRRQGRTAEAEQLWARAAEAGNAEAAVHLGFLRHEAGDLAGAERWWRRSAEQGSSMGAFYFGHLLARSERTAEAERWWRAAAEHLGDPEKFTGSHRPQGTGSTVTLSSAAESGEALSAHALAGLLYERGERAEAERWWTTAARAGHTEALLRIAQVAMNDHDDVDGCLRWLRIAVAREDLPVERLETVARALHSLATGLFDPSRPDDPAPPAAISLAVEAYRRLHAQDPAAYERGLAGALHDLARLSLAAGDTEAAGAAFGQLGTLRRQPD
ncbi:tetratricopeptide repeat protein [Streptomyces sp. NPDC048696]|uniref:tetratricopeptide repeat protein n=1 Tax=Streptomyces sp. NPDC048696 TaxID=3365585 RepID=UPI00371D6FD5